MVVKKEPHPNDLLLTATFTTPFLADTAGHQYIIREVKIAGYFSSSDNQHLLVVSNEGTQQQYIQGSTGKVQNIVVSPTEQQHIDQIVQALSGLNEQDMATVVSNGPNVNLPQSNRLTLVG